jgi:cysteine sulfinate desulfinase/cysteine desulfurase-like protein
VALEPLIQGAGHENGRRAGTESALLIAAFGEACELAKDLSAVAYARCAIACGTDCTKRSVIGSC